MASKDKRCVELNSQDTADDKTGKSVSRSGRRGKPQVEIYRPGSGPLRKSTLQVEDDNQGSDHKCKISSETAFQHVDSARRDVGHVIDKVKDVITVTRRKSKKPQQAMYIPKPVAQAMVERELLNSKKSVTNQSSHRDQHCENLYSDYLTQSSQPDQKSIRFSGSRRNNRPHEGNVKHQSDNRDGSWQSSSCRNSQNIQHKVVEDPISNREIRQASEPRVFPPNNSFYDANRTRDTRSVEPVGTGSWGSESLQRKPPSGRRGSCRDNVNANNKPNQKSVPSSFLAPRFKKKYLLETSMNTVGATVEDAWDGSTVTFLGSGKTNIDSQAIYSQQLPSEQFQGNAQQRLNMPQPSPQFWSHTLPSSRGRGRLRPEDVEKEKLENAKSFTRSLTPDHLSSISYTPVDYRSTPHLPFSSEQELYRVSNIEKVPLHIDDWKMQNLPHQFTNRASGLAADEGCESFSNASPSACGIEKQRESISNDLLAEENVELRASSPTQNEPCSVSLTSSSTVDIFCNISPKILDWSEDVENELLQAEAVLLSDSFTRSSSVVSLPEDRNHLQSRRDDVRRKRRRRRSRDGSASYVRGNSLERGHSMPPQDCPTIGEVTRRGSVHRGTSKEHSQRGNSKEPSHRGASKDRLHHGTSRVGSHRGASEEHQYNHEATREQSKRDPKRDRSNRASCEPDIGRSNRGTSREPGTKKEHGNRDSRKKQSNHDLAKEYSNRGSSKDSSARTSGRESSTHGFSRESVNRGPRKDRTNQGSSKERQYMGQSREVLNQDQSIERLKAGLNKDRYDRGLSRECSNRGLSRERYEYGSSKEHRRSSRERVDRCDPGSSIECLHSRKTREQFNRVSNKDNLNHGLSKERSNQRQSKERSIYGLGREHTNRRPSIESLSYDSSREHSVCGSNKDLSSHGSNKERSTHDLNREHFTHGVSKEGRNRRGQSRGDSQERNQNHSHDYNLSNRKKHGDHKDKRHEEHSYSDRRREARREEQSWNDRWKDVKRDDLERNARWQEKPNLVERQKELRDNVGQEDRWREEGISSQLEVGHRKSRQECVDNIQRSLNHGVELASDLKVKNADKKVGINNQIAGILVLPTPLIDSQHVVDSDTTTPVEQYEQPIAGTYQRLLYDPNNPNKPIVVSAPGTRAATRSEREYEAVPHVLPGYSGSSTYQDIPNVAIGMHVSSTDSLNTTRPAWLDSNSEAFASARSPHTIMDADRAVKELQFVLVNGILLRDWDHITSLRHTVEAVFQTFLTTDLKFCEKENVEKYLWNVSYYNVIEMLRHGTVNDAECKEEYKKKMLHLIEDGTAFLENLVEVLQQTYKFKVENFLLPHTSSSKMGFVGLALISVQKIFIFLGDLARYREQVNETSNYGKSRQWYIKAHQINPKNGLPYNQLAVLAVHARRRLDAVYYYMRNLMASNPIYTARENLILLFDESRRKFELMDKKRRDEQQVPLVNAKDKESGKGLHREFWIHPRQGIPRLHITSAVPDRLREIYFQEEELKKLDNVELNKRFITSYLNVHGKLFTKVGMDTFQETALHMLLEFRALLQNTPVPLTANRFLQLLALNMFAIENTQIRETGLEPEYRAALQEYALIVSLQMFNLILERCNSLLKDQLDNPKEERSRLLVSEDMLLLLPAVKVWCDWLLCHGHVWNPPPSCSEYKVGPPDDAWNRMATLMNLLEKLDLPKHMLVSTPQEGCDIVKLPEDATLCEFTPLMYISDDATYCNRETDMEIAQVVLRIKKIIFFGTVYLCGTEPPVLKLQHSESGDSEYISVCQPPPTGQELQSNSELRLESFSEDENEDVDDKVDSERRANIIREAFMTDGLETLTLLQRKEELERDLERHKIIVQEILRANQVYVEMEVKPRLLVPDTNTFIDHLDLLKTIIEDKDDVEHFYTFMVPLVVFRELEGLSLGGKDRFVPDAKVEHVAMVAEAALNALSFLRSKHPQVRCVTTRGTIMNVSSCAMHEEADEYVCNDDRILATAVNLCSQSEEIEDLPEGTPRRVHRGTVLLTEDRCLRLKAMTKLLPTRDIPHFIEWAGLG